MNLKNNLVVTNYNKVKICFFIYKFIVKRNIVFNNKINID